jgi:DNA mismatch repair protein MutS2
LKGFIHDESASGQTLYLEPTSALSGNNRLQILLREERREEEAILRRLSALVRRDAADLAGNQEILACFDYNAAAAQFSRRYAGTVPQLTVEPLVELRAARHPLLLFQPNGEPRGGEVVPIDLLLGAGCDTLVVSGPNTGGKTVALKTVGLLLLMVRSGLPIPCAPDSRLHLFGRIFADIGDEQSIEGNLSTFSGHLTRIRQILTAADGDSLVLLDEAGTGTDPAEGGALALAVLDTLRARGARVILTTHLNLIKGYAHLNRGVENAAVEFDGRTLAPSYRLHYGIPGTSSAFAIARLLGIPEKVLATAADYLGSGEQEGLSLIEELNRLRKELAAEREEARRSTAEAHRERDRRRQLLRELEEQRKSLLDKTARRGEEQVRAAERKLSTLLRKAEETTAIAPPERAGLLGELRSVKSEVARLRPAPARGKIPKETQVGEVLRVPALGAEGEVVRVASGEVELSVQGKKLRLPLRDLEQFSPRRFAARRKGGMVRSSVVRDGFQPRLILIGKRIDAALPLLDRFLDDALLHGIREVEVVHGAGEGILRRGVRDFLARHQGVAAFRGGDMAQGGENVTTVELRET